MISRTIEFYEIETEGEPIRFLDEEAAIALNDMMVSMGSDPKPYKKVKAKISMCLKDMIRSSKINIKYINEEEV